MYLKHLGPLFDNISKHLKILRKLLAMCHIFNSLFGNMVECLLSCLVEC